MRNRYLGEILAMLLVGSSAFMLMRLDSHGILSCLPLLVGLWAVSRGATWAAFAVLAGACGLLAMTIAGQAPWPLAIGAGSAVVPTLIVLPSLWRFDRLATQILTGTALVLGIAGALLFYAGVQEPAQARCTRAHESPALPSASAPVTTTWSKPTAAPAIEEAPCVAADLVGIYELSEPGGSLRLDADRGFLRDLDDGATTRGTFDIDKRQVVLTSSEGQIERMACSTEGSGHFTLQGLTVWEVAR
jgi:hypothetical protein